MMVRLGSELIEGVTLGSGDWVIEPLSRERPATPAK
jgi:hypothetical protein